MYAQRFGLTREPFSIAPDPRFLFMSERHREALAHLLYGLQGGGGFVLLTGEIGAGKTTVCRCFLERVPAHCNVAYVFNPRLTELELLATVCDEFHITPPLQADGTPARTAKPWIDALNAFLLAAHAQGQQNVLVIDEAQNLAPGLLEQLRLLTNLETAERKLLQIMLIGQPELREMLAAPALAPLAQRVIARYHLQALDAAECEAYIRHRLGVAGLAGAVPFDAGALRRIHALTRGVPRRINLLCDRALLGAYGGGHAAVDRRIVDRAAAEVFGPEASSGRGLLQPGWRPAGPWRAGAAVLVVAGVTATAAWLASRGEAPAAGGQPSASGALAAAASAPRPDPAASAGPAPEAATAGAGTAPRPVAELRPWFDRLPRDERRAWHALTQAWQQAGTGNGVAAAASTPASTPVGTATSSAATLPADDPCAAGQPLRCQRTQLTLAQIRTLDRPGLLVLRDGAAPPAYVLLLGLAYPGAGRAATEAGGVPAEAWLQVDDQRLRVPLPELARWWQGEFMTLWQPPPGLPPGWQRGGEAVEQWLDARLRQLPGTPATAASQPPRQRIAAFQRAHGLQPDGVAGPMTLMQLNRAAGIPEPHLHTEP